MADLGTNANAYLFEGIVFPLQWAKNGTTIKYSADPDAGTFYDTGASLTSAETAAWEEQGNGDILVTNQTDSNLRIAVARNTVAIGASDTEITVGADWIDKFDDGGGTVYVRGDEIDYTGVNATQLTGVTGLVSAHPINSIITQTSNPSTWTEEKGTFLFELESRMIVGGRLHFENILYASAPEDANNPQFFYDFDGNGTVSRVFTTPLVGGIRGLSSSYVFGKNQVHEVLGFDVATGAFQVRPLSDHYGAYNQRCIVDMDGIVAFLGRKRLMPITLTLSPDGSVPSFDEEFDSELRPWLDALDDDQSGATLSFNPTNKILKISALRNGALETYGFDLQSKAFFPIESRPAVSYSMFNGKPYFGGLNGKVYADDMMRTNDGNAILHAWATGRMEYDKGRQYMQLHSLEYDGFMSQDCEHSVNVYLDGSSTASYSMDFTDSLITSSQGTPIGARGVGVSPLGGDAMSVFAYPFKNTILLVGLSGEDVKVEWTCSKQGAFFQTNSYSLMADLTRFSQRTYS